MKSICEPDIRCIAMQVTVFPVMRETRERTLRWGRPFPFVGKILDAGTGNKRLTDENLRELRCRNLKGIEA